jgi:hypothetical protein
MIKGVPVSIIIAGAALMIISQPVRADKPPCPAFQKMPNGKWNVVKLVKIENGSASVMLKPGTSIVPGMLVTNYDVYSALEKSCQ